MEFPDFLNKNGMDTGQHVMLHCAFRQVKKAFPGIEIKKLVNDVQNIVTTSGSLVMPTFTYCFKHGDENHEIYVRDSTPSKVGAVSEVFRTMPNVVRTASPTHSFALWGKLAEIVDIDRSPESPLGSDSVLDMLAKTPHSFVFMLGTDFSSLSFGHYIEIRTPVPWADIYPWEHLGVLPVGISEAGEQPLSRVPGCSKSFIAFERYLLREKKLQVSDYEGLQTYYLPVDHLIETGVEYFKEYPDTLLCKPGDCAVCNERWHKYLQRVKRRQEIPS